jgi:hypothetical protein
MIQGMKIARLSFLIGAFLLCKNVSFLHAEAEAPDPIVLEQERRLKDDTERQAQGICDSILGKGKSSVLVNVELGLESSRKGGSALNQKRDNKSGLGDDNFLLPWVPAPKSVTKEETPKDASVETQAAQQASMDVKTVLRRFDITVVHDEKIPKERIVAAQETLTSTFDRYKAVLKLFFRATSFVSEHSSDGEVVKKNIIESLNLKTILLLFLLMLLFMLIRFFLGPLADFLKNYIDGMKEQSKSKVEMENKSENENDSESETENEDEGNLDGAGGELTPEEQALLEAQEEAMKKFEPFTYVTDENLKQLAYLLHHEEPWIVALVISYLTAERALKVMEALPADLQAKVALETAMYRQTSLEQVQAINEDIKQKIDFVVGCLDELKRRDDMHLALQEQRQRTGDGRDIVTAGQPADDRHVQESTMHSDPHPSICPYQRYGPDYDDRDRDRQLDPPSLEKETDRDEHPRAPGQCSLDALEDRYDLGEYEYRKQDDYPDACRDDDRRIDEGTEDFPPESLLSSQFFCEVI